MVFTPLVESWRPTLEQQANGIPINFLLAWLTHESGGNPCATGFVGKQDPRDGLFKFEAGIGQNFFEARSFDALFPTTSNGVTLAQLRKGCNGQTITNRSAVDDEAQVRAFLADVERFRDRSHQQLGAVGSQADAEELEDFWMFVKLQHALPAIPRFFLAAAAESGAADSFERFAGFVENLDLETMKRLDGSGGGVTIRRGATLAKIFNNARKTGAGSGANFFDFVAPSGTGGAFVVPAVLLVASLLLSKGGV